MGSFTLDQPITGLVAIIGMVDLIVADHPPVPPWWEFFQCQLGAAGKSHWIERCAAKGMPSMAIQGSSYPGVLPISPPSAAGSGVD